MEDVSSKSYIRRNLPLLFITGMVICVLLAGFLFLPRTEEDRTRLVERLGTSNQGELLKPLVAIDDLDLQNDAGELWVLKDQLVKWRLVIPLASRCDQACSDALYLTRQIHVRLDKKSSRVERILLNLNDALDEDTRAFLEQEHHYLKIVNGRTEQFKQLLDETNAGWSPDRAQVFVVDQNGDAMMFYTAEHDGADMLSDLRHLLKYSPEF